MKFLEQVLPQKIIRRFVYYYAINYTLSIMIICPFNLLCNVYRLIFLCTQLGDYTVEHIFFSYRKPLPMEMVFLSKRMSLSWLQEPLKGTMEYYSST